mgnify:CR=1 FL=1
MTLIYNRPKDGMSYFVKRREGNLIGTKAAFWVSPNPWPLWCPNVDFQWVPNAMVVKYLSFLLGVEKPNHHQFEHVKDKINKKL